MTPQPPPQNPIAAEALAKARALQHRLANSFSAVFGQPGNRSEAQRLVYDHLALDDNHNSYEFGSAKDGIAIIAAGIHRDGAKSLIRIIDRQLKIAAIVREEKPKVKSKR